MCPMCMLLAGSLYRRTFVLLEVGGKRLMFRVCSLAVADLVMIFVELVSLYGGDKV